MLLDEAETLLGIEELHRALAGADDLGGHAAETAATATAAARAARATAAEAAATAARTTAAAAVAITTTATAEPVAATATEAVTASEPVAAEIAGRKTVIPAAKRIEAIFAETVALVAAAPASPIVTHRSTRTLPHCPSSYAPMS
nr:hypothetical protein [Erythrobacter donghaensis]